MKPLLSINIIHTNVGNYQLIYNTPLLNNIKRLGEETSGLVQVNILLNGANVLSNRNKLIELLDLDPRETMHDPELPDTEDYFVQIYTSKETLPLGSARDMLAEKCQSDHYINVDEDDNFHISGVTDLLKVIPFIGPYKIALFGFNWFYKKVDGSSKIWIFSKKNPVEPEFWENKKNLESPLSYYAGRGLCSWNILHNKREYELAKLIRPAINKYDDVFFYTKLVNYFPEVPFIQTMVYDYHGERGTMSSEKDPYLDIVTAYISETPFKVVELIDPKDFSDDVLKST